MKRTLTLAAIVLLGTNAYAQQPARVSNVPIGDEFFAMKAYAEGLAEVAISRLAMEHATQPAIREFAEKMVRDHTECNNKIVELCRRKGIALPAAIDPIHTAVINRLAMMTGSDFDKAYMKAQMCAHKDALHLFEHESCKGEDSEVKELASKELSTREEHTKQAFDVAGDKEDYKKFSKIHDYAKQVMNEK